jgi:hypothetical protein
VLRVLLVLFLESVPPALPPWPCADTDLLSSAVAELILSRPWVLGFCLNERYR